MRWRTRPPASCRSRSAPRRGRDAPSSRASSARRWKAVEREAELGLEGRARRGHGLDEVVVDGAVLVDAADDGLVEAGSVVVVRRRRGRRRGGGHDRRGGDRRRSVARDPEQERRDGHDRDAVPTAVQSSARLRIGAPWASRRSARRRLLIPCPSAPAAAGRGGPRGAAGGDPPRSPWRLAHRFRILPMTIEAS